ncbi:MAG: hypothetical protein KDA77_00325 [Planctomycetaceae bacterium]|nr:hypothetical protein [Planctomycetaceae bacterium]
MGRISMDLKDGEGVAVFMPCHIKIRNRKGKGRNRRRCVILFNGRGKAHRVILPKPAKEKRDVSQ